MADVTVLVIDRSKWLRGKRNGRLLRDDGMMCCLGFLGVSCGIAPEQMLGLMRPDSEAVATAPWPEWLMSPNQTAGWDGGERCSAEAELLMGRNDDDDIEEAERERLVAAVFAKHGVEVRFVDSTEQPRAAPSSPPDPSTEIR